MKDDSRLDDAINQYQVDQRWDQYSSEDHDTWRFATTELASVLHGNTYVNYERAFAETGLQIEQIPSLNDVSSALSKFGWRSLVVEGFIPPDVFMLFQANAVLPISRPMRSRSQLGYTPVPDILHEAAGHLPMLNSSGYREFLSKLGNIGAKVQLTDTDMKLYEQQKQVAELTADDLVNPTDLERARTKLAETFERVRFEATSKARLVARFHWWTVEYGLIGPDHLVYGAGLLSSAAEAATFRDVEHNPLTIECCDLGFEIDHAQPCLFVAESWKQLDQELDKLAELVL